MHDLASAASRSDMLSGMSEVSNGLAFAGASSSALLVSSWNSALVDGSVLGALNAALAAWLALLLGVGVTFALGNSCCSGVGFAAVSARGSILHAA